MGLLLKQSTAVDLLVGPFVDEDDGKTAETGLTVTQAEVRLSKNGGNMAQKNEATALSHDELGYYVCKLDATDTNTLGRLQLCIHESGALPVYHEFMVVTANHYDSQCSTDYKQVDVIQVAGVAEDISTETKQDVIDGIVDTILVDTNEIQGKLPTNKIMGSSDTDNHDTDIDAILVDTGTTLQGDITTIKKYVGNKWAIVGNQLIFYDDDKATPIRTFTLDSATAPTSRTPV